jgi:DNA-binding response OmpR family regulator
VTLPTIPRPHVVTISDGHGFAHLVRTLLEDLNVSVRISSVAERAVRLVEELQPDLVIIDLVPGQERDCWLVLEALQARPSTQAIPVVLCPVIPWLLDGHEHRLAQHGIRVWCEPFALRDLLEQIEATLEEQPAHRIARHDPAAAADPS